MLTSSVKHVAGPLVRSMMVDATSRSIFRDYEACVKCDACVSACEEQGFNVYDWCENGNVPTTCGDVPLEQSRCVGCGQCTTVCPVASIVESDHLTDVEALLVMKDELKAQGKILVASVAPTVRVGISEPFGEDVGTNLEHQIATGLRNLGFDYVFDTCFTADLTIMEEGTELLGRLTDPDAVLPMFTSCCPGWVNSVEKLYPELIPNLSSCMSPQGMMGSMVKTAFAQKIGVAPEDIIHVSLMPCTAKKDEMARPDLLGDVNYVLTVREAARLFQNAGVDLPNLEPGLYDTPLGESTGAGVIFGASGGVMEAGLRTAYELLV
ncbi:hypothetical protein KIPB_007998, partial [Kipferlia bialata]|eukprot:g7998.t1